MMYYTQDLQGDSFLECYDDERPDLSKHMPADSDVPPPRNLELEEMGDGHSHHKHMEGEGEKEEEQEPIHANTDLSMQGTNLCRIVLFKLKNAHEHSSAKYHKEVK